MSKRAQQVLNGRDGSLYFNGENLQEVKSVDIKVTKNKEALKFVGDIWEHHDVSSVSGSGSMSAHKVSSKLNKVATSILETGYEEYFELVSKVFNKKSGKTERVLLQNVSFDEATLASFDVDTAKLTEEMPFTFTGMKWLDRIE